MIIVNIEKAPDEPSEEYTVVATLTVHDDGTTTIEDPGKHLLTDLHVLVVDDDPEVPVRKVTFEEDPATWARNLDFIYRTGYFAAVVVRDDENPEVPAR